MNNSAPLATPVDNEQALLTDNGVPVLNRLQTILIEPQVVGQFEALTYNFADRLVDRSQLDEIVTWTWHEATFSEKEVLFLVPDFGSKITLHNNYLSAGLSKIAAGLCISIFALGYLEGVYFTNGNDSVLEAVSTYKQLLMDYARSCLTEVVTDDGSTEASLVFRLID